MPKAKVDDKYNFCYVYWVLNEIRDCVHEGYAKNTLNRYRMSKLVPKLEKVLNDVCNDSENY